VIAVGAILVSLATLPAIIVAAALPAVIVAVMIADQPSLGAGTSMALN
jgi:hypothetical protein